MEAFIEHEQDRGIKITIRLRLTGVQSFSVILQEEGIVSPDIFGKRIRFAAFHTPPRAMNPDDYRSFSVIEGSRDRAMILVLLRTGMRIGELLNTKAIDVHMKERRIEIYEATRTDWDGWVYLSEDAIIALKAWLEERNPWEDSPFLQSREYGHDVLQYSWCRFKKYIIKAGLDHKGYTPHTLRHTLPRSFQRRHAPGMSPGKGWGTVISKRHGVMPGLPIRPARRNILGPWPS